MKTANKSLISHISSAARAAWAWAWAWAADLPRSKNTESDHLNDHLSDHLVTSEGRSSSDDMGTGFCGMQNGCFTTGHNDHPCPGPGMGE